MLNRKDYRKYWVKEPPQDDVCKGCDLLVTRNDAYGCPVIDFRAFNCIERNKLGYITRYAVFKLIKK